MSVQDLVTAGETLFTTAAGKNISAKTAANVNEVSSGVMLVLSLLQRNTKLNIDGIVSGATQVLQGVNQILVAAKPVPAVAAPSTGVGASA